MRSALLAACCFFPAALAFLGVGLLQRQPAFIALGLTFVVLGGLWLVIARRRRGASDA